METLELKIQGLHCDGCVKSVTRVLSAIAGVDAVDVSLAEGRAMVRFDFSRTGREAFARAVERAGYHCA